MIGLLGAWGAGKSTVVRLVQKEIEKLSQLSDEHTFCFQYDAWLHQSDPLRRAFLETLVEFLINEGLTTRDQWQRRLDQLNRKIEESETTSTPTLTLPGKIIALCLLFWPVSFLFLNREWSDSSINLLSFLQCWLPLLPLITPIVVIVITYFFWLPIRNPFKRRFYQFSNFYKHRPPHEEESIFGLLVNKEVLRQRNRITRTPDPTTLEFQEIFSEIMSTVRREKRTFLFVIDNLDRLPETDAVAMWGTIRSFFLGTENTKRALRPEEMPIVILPIDEEAIRRMYRVSHGDSADILAKSFIEKIFDLTFHVPKPVLSDWNKYLENQMKGVFGTNMPQNWPYIVGRFYERQIIQTAGNATPRSINTLINAIAVLWLEWHKSGVSFAAVSYYCTFRATIHENIIQSVSMQIAPIFDLDFNWQRGIAALYYGVSLDVADQVLIEQPLQKSITDNDSDQFTNLSKIVSFDRVLLRVLERFSAGNIDSSVVFRAAILLDKLGDIDQEWHGDAWNLIFSAFLLAAQWQKFDQEQSFGVIAIANHCRSEKIEELVTSLNGRFLALNANVHQEIDFPKTFLNSWASIYQRGNALERPVHEINVPGDARKFLDISVKFLEYKDLLKILTPSVDDKALVQELASEIKDAGRAIFFESRFLSVYNMGRRIDWDELIDAAVAICRDQNANHTGMPGSLLVLGIAQCESPQISETVRLLISGDRVAARLAEAYSQRIDVVIARTLALLLLNKNYGFQVPENGAWSQRFEQIPQLVDLIDQAIREFSIHDENVASQLFDAARSNAALVVIVKPLIGKRIQRGNLGTLDVEHIVANFQQYIQCVDGDMQSAFITALSDNPQFWDYVAKLALNKSGLTIYRALMNNTNDLGKLAQEKLVEAINNLDPKILANAIRNAEESMLIANELVVHLGTVFELGQNLYKSLHEMISEIVSKPDSNLRHRWFDAAKFLSANSRKTVFSNLRDSLLNASSPPQLSALLEAGGDLFVEDGGFRNKADDCVRLIVVQLLDTEDGLKWLVNHAPLVGSWLKMATSTTIDFLREERLSILTREEDAIRKESAEKLMAEWFPSESTQRTSKSSSG